MGEPRPEQAVDGNSNSNGPAAGTPPGAGPLTELQVLLDDLKSIGLRLFGDLSSLALAQWRLTSYILSGSIDVWVIRARTTLLIWALVIASWVFLNVAAWRVASDLTTLSWVPPLALLALNGGTSVILHYWRKGVRLK